MANQEKRPEQVRVIGENGGFRKGNYPCQQIWAQEWDLPETAAGLGIYLPFRLGVTPLHPLV
jgi:hypothetical protein